MSLRFDENYHGASPECKRVLVEDYEPIGSVFGNSNVIPEAFGGHRELLNEFGASFSERAQASESSMDAIEAPEKTSTWLTVNSKMKAMMRPKRPMLVDTAHLHTHFPR
jgi:hypothetical protein